MRGEKKVKPDDRTFIKFNAMFGLCAGIGKR